MFKNPFAILMALTFIAAVITVLAGISGLGAGNNTGNRSTRLMSLRVALCALLLLEIIIYITWLKP